MEQLSKARVRYAGMWLVLVVMAAMVFCGCKEKTIKKADENWADVSDKEFEKVGYLFGTKEENKPKYPRSEYFYVVKNNSKITVSIRGTATAYSSDQELEKVIQESHYAPRYSHERLEGYADVILDK